MVFLLFMDRIIIPPEYLEIIDGPLVFVAGPIQGASRWQDRAASYLLTKDAGLHVASPRRLFDRTTDYSTVMYHEQVDWETYHLRKAGELGAILFWLIKESEHRCDRAYAETTRFELGEWKMRHEQDGIKLVIGIEKGFTGERYLRRRLMQDCPEILICSTLEETCDQALLLIRSA